MPVDPVFKALADETRRQLLDRLYKNNGQTLRQLGEHLKMTRQAVTKHLALLEAANLIAIVWRGREKLHFLNPVPLHEIYERWISKYERQRLQALSDFKKNLEPPKKLNYGKEQIRLCDLHPHHPRKIMAGVDNAEVSAPVFLRHHAATGALHLYWEAFRNPSRC